MLIHYSMFLFSRQPKVHHFTPFVYIIFVPSSDAHEAASNVEENLFIQL